MVTMFIPIKIVVGRLVRPFFLSFIYAKNYGVHSNIQKLGVISNV